MLTFYLIETLEYLSLFVDGDTDTGVTDLQYQPVLLFFQGYGNAFPVVRIFKGIG